MGRKECLPTDTNEPAADDAENGQQGNSEKERARTARRHAREGRPVHDEHAARGKDVVTEASEESFPASDAPAWTPTTSVSAADPEEDGAERTERRDQGS